MKKKENNQNFFKEWSEVISNIELGKNKPKEKYVSFTKEELKLLFDIVSGEAIYAAETNKKYSFNSCIKKFQYKTDRKIKFK